MMFEIDCQTLMAEADAVPKNRRNCRKVQSKRHNHHHHFDQGQSQREERTQLPAKDLIIGDEYAGGKSDSKKISPPLTCCRKFCTIWLDKKMLVNSAFLRGNVLKIKKLKKMGLGLDKHSSIVLYRGSNNKKIRRLEKH